MRKAVFLILIILFALSNISEIQSMTVRIQAYISKRLNLSSDFDKAVLSQAYILDEKVLEFPIIKRTNRLRLITNANIIHIKDKEELYKYALEYELLNAAGEVIKKKTYNKISKIGEKTLDGENVQQYFYLNTEYTPADARVAVLSDPEISFAEKVRLRLVKSDESVMHVSIRLYFEDTQEIENIRATWQRLTSQSKEETAGASVYPYQMLTNEEIRNLLSYRWMPLGPAGVIGQDYELVQMYSYREAQPAPSGEDTLPYGFPVRPEQAFTFKTDEKYSEYIITVKNPDFDEGNLSIVQNIYGQNPGEKQQKLIYTSYGRNISVKNNGSLIELIADKSAVYDIKGLTKENETEEADIRISVVRGYHGTGDSPVSFRIFRKNNEIVPIRFTARYVIDGLAAAQRSVVYELVGRDGNIIKKYEIPLTADADIYQSFSGTDFRVKLSRSTDTYFSLSPDVHEVRVYGGVFVNGSKALLKPRIKKIPQDTVRYADYLKQAVTWFNLRPVNYEEKIRLGQADIIRMYTEPVDDNSLITMGSYLFEQSEAEGEVFSAEVLQKSQSSADFVRSEALNATFFKIGREEQIFEFASKQGSRKTTPQFIAVNTDKEDKITIILDEKEYEYKVYGSVWQGVLPEIDTGLHSVRISSGSAEIFINNIKSEEQDKYILRTPYRISPGRTLIFKVKKYDESEQSAGISFYTLSKGRRAELRGEINTDARKLNTPLEGWTIPEYRLIYENSSDNKAHGLNSKKTLYPHEPAYVRIDKDLPAGNYSLRITNMSDETGYVFVNTLVPGFFDKIEYFYEENNR